MKKKITVLGIVLFLMAMGGCSEASVDYAKRIASMEKNKIAFNLPLYHEQIEQEKQQKKENGNNNSENTIEVNNKLNDEANKKIEVRNIGDIIKQNGMEVKISAVKIVDNIYDVNDIADETQMRTMADDLLDSYGADSKFSKFKNEVRILEDGSLNSTYKQMIYVKMQITNMRDKEYEICFAPNFYVEYSQGKYENDTKIEAETISNIQNKGNNKLYFNFLPGQTEEIIVAASSRRVISDEILLMDVKFVSGDYSEAVDVGDASVLIKIKEGDYEDEN